MSFKAKMAAAAATFALAGGGLGLLGTLSASAATHRCGSKCQDLYTQKFGHRYLLATFRGKAAADQEVILYKASNRDPAEDFVMKDLGSVGSFYSHYRRLITPQFDTSYSAISAYELQYAAVRRQQQPLPRHLAGPARPGGLQGAPGAVRRAPKLRLGHFHRPVCR